MIVSPHIVLEAFPILSRDDASRVLSKARRMLRAEAPLLWELYLLGDNSFLNYIDDQMLKEISLLRGQLRLVPYAMPLVGARYNMVLFSVPGRGKGNLLVGFNGPCPRHLLEPLDTEQGT